MSYNKIMNSDEYYGYEDRNYINPTMSRDEQLSFVDNLRKTQDRANTDIETQTHGLGMQIPSRKGGLNAFSTQLNTTGTGGPLLDENGVAKTNPDSFFNKRYQTPQLNSQVAALRSAAQASALNNILANEQAQYKKRYNAAYKAAQKRAAAAAANPSADPDYLTGDVETEAFDPTPKPEATKDYISISQPGTAEYLGSGEYRHTDPNGNVTSSKDLEYVPGRDLNDRMNQGVAVGTALSLLNPMFAVPNAIIGGISSLFK